MHDCFTITEILNYEDLGFCGRGEGGRFVEEGRAALGGEKPVNPSGGLKSYGHPIGATGVRMIYELTTQLRGQAGERQVKNARDRPGAQPRRSRRGLLRLDPDQRLGRQGGRRRAMRADASPSPSTSAVVHCRESRRLRRAARSACASRWPACRRSFERRRSFGVTVRARSVRACRRRWRMPAGTVFAGAAGHDREHAV